MRLIDADALEEWIYIDECEYNNKYDIEAVEWESIENAPTIDAEPIKHGKWKHTITWQPYCSNCEYVFGEDEEFSPFWKFCPMCGAKMNIERTE